MYEAIALAGFSFAPPPDNSLEDTGRQNDPSPRLIVPVAMDRLGQRAKMPVSVPLGGSSDNVDSSVPCWLQVRRLEG
jgi:hypothetical protein